MLLSNSGSVLFYHAVSTTIPVRRPEPAAAGTPGGPPCWFTGLSFLSSPRPSLVVLVALFSEMAEMLPACLHIRIVPPCFSQRWQSGVFKSWSTGIRAGLASILLFILSATSAIYHQMPYAMLCNDVLREGTKSSPDV